MQKVTIWPRRDFRLPAFDLAPLEFDLEELADELLLTTAVASGAAGVVHLVHPHPTPGELNARIQHHLDRARPPQDAAGELRDALADLRRSLG